VIIKNVNRAADGLRKCAQAKPQAVTGPRLFLHGKKLSEFCLRCIEARFQARYRFCLAEAMWDHNNKRFRHPRDMGSQADVSSVTQGECGFARESAVAELSVR
jgi:hypothetical protein